MQAARLAKDLEPYHLFYLEDVLRPEYKESFRLVREHSTTPLAMGELFNTLWDCVPLIKEQLIDYIRCDLGHIGGITNARKVAALAEAFQVQTAWHGSGGYRPSDARGQCPRGYFHSQLRRAGNGLLSGRHQ